MKVRNKATGASRVQGDASYFNTHALNEIIVGFEDGSMDSCYIKDFEVLVDGEWIDMREAFRLRLLITDNYNTRFFEPATEEDKVRGYTL